MTPEKESPTAPIGQSRVLQGQRNEKSIAPAWARKRQPAKLLRFQGEYLTPGELTAQTAQEAARGRVCRPGTETAVLAQVIAQGLTDGPGTESGPGADPHPRKPDALDWLLGGREGPAPEVLPCRSLGTTQYGGVAKALPRSLSGAHKKTAQALSWNVDYLCKKYGVERVGFLTLTFADHVLDAREASRRFNSLATNVLKKRYAEYIRVLERQKNGRIHYHLLVVLDADIRTGFDFDAIAKRDYSTASPRIRLEWAFWRKSAKGYGFGRTELLPIKSSSEGMAQYVGKYIGKHFNAREESDKGVRLVSYSRGARMASSRFTRCGTKQSTEWRAKLYTFVLQLRAAQVLGKNNKHGYLRIETMADLTRHLGKNWAFQWREHIFSLPPSDLAIPF